jgi:hypothetical protein
MVIHFVFLSATIILFYIIIKIESLLLNSSVGELVQHGENGLVFQNAAELSEQLIDWFMGFPQPNPRHAHFMKQIETFRSLRWHQNWVLNAMPLFKN